MTQQLDSRSGSVILDYDTLTVKGPITFEKSVLGFTWPREYRVGGTGFLYTQPATAILPLTTQTVFVNEFPVGTFPITHTTIFNVANDGRINVVRNNTHIQIRTRLTVTPNGLNTPAATYKFQLMFDPSAGPAYSLGDFIVQPGAAGPYLEVVTQSIHHLANNGDAFYMQATGTTNFNAILEYTIHVLK
jgi:hypothetical protein